MPPVAFMIAVAIVIVFFAFLKMKGKKAAAVAIEEGKTFLEENKKKPEVQTTSSGLQYQLLDKADSQEQASRPNAQSTVTVHYHGTLLDGTVFDSSVDRGQSISFGLNQVIPGWTEGLQLMEKGDKTRFFIPSHLAYGNRAVGTIKPGSTLIFDVELIDFH